MTKTSRLQETLRIARAIRKFEATVAYDDEREPVGKKVKRWQRARTPELPDWAQEVRPHDPEWKERFEREADALRQAIGADLVDDVQHFGSSAISHLASKPVLDLMVAVKSDLDDPRLLDGLAAVGYEPYGNSPCDHEAEWFWRIDGDCVWVAHVCDHRNPWRHTAVNFRDYMRLHPDECARYENVKKDLAADPDASLLEYSLGKLALFYDISAKADAWVASGETGGARTG